MVQSELDKNMSQKSKMDTIKKFYFQALEKNELAFVYLDYSGVIVRISNQTVLIDPANLLQGEAINVLQGVNLLIFTHYHGDHYSFQETLDIVNATGCSVLAEPLVADDLREKIPPEKLTSAKPGKTYVIGDITVSTVQGIHGCPINLYQIKLGDIGIFHAGDSGYVSVERQSVDLAFLPTGIERPFIPTATPENAFKMAFELMPSVVVAIHGSVRNSKDFEDKVKQMMPTTTVIIPEQYQTKTVTFKNKIL